MSQTFSTLQREMATGRVFSSRNGLVTVLPPQAPLRGAPSPAPAKPSPAFQFVLSGLGLPYGSQAGLSASGIVQLREIHGSACKVMATIQALRPPSDPSVRPVFWLIHDLLVPSDAAPADVAALARGASGTGNRPGSVFTLDGNAPTYELTGNTVSVAISPGTFQPGSDGAWRLDGEVNPQTNQAFHPLVILGPTAMADIDAALPSGVAAEILQSMFMKPATVHPELDLRSHFAQRLATIATDVLGAGVPHYIQPEQFGRAAVTMEGPLRGTPRLMPTRDACFLLGLTRTVV